MPYISLHEFDSLEQLIGIDVDIKVHGMMDNPIGRIIDVTAPDTDLELGDEGYPYDDIEIVIEDHLLDRSWTRSARDSISAAIIGDEYTLHFGEERQDDGTWERVTDKKAMKSGARSAVRATDTTGETRVMTQTYEAGMDHVDQFPLRATSDGIDSVLTGRSDLPTCIAGLTVDQWTDLHVEGETTVNRIRMTITDASPDLPEFDPQSSKTYDAADLADSYTITGTDVFGGAVTVTYDNLSETATVERTPPETIADDEELPHRVTADDDPGELNGELLGIGDHGVLEWYSIPWMDDLEEIIEIPDGLETGSIGHEIGTVYVDPDNKYELYHASIDGTFSKRRATVNDIITVDTPMTYGRSES